ncbi:MAG: GHKL domain-containing protein [Acetatifactor sp.]|nr:GHKL domain-containing protein [Acetatifactor sp.]
MYDVILAAMDVVVYSFWGWCLYRFCGCFLVRKKPGHKRRKETGEIVTPISRNFFFRNAWPLWCFWAVWKWLHDLLTDSDYNSVHTLLRTLLLYGTLFLFLRVLYEGRRGALLFSFVTFTAVSEISRFLAYSVSPLGTWVYDVATRMLEEGSVADLEAYLRLIKIHSCFMQMFMNAVFMLCLRGTLYRVDRAFRGRSRAFDRVELKFLLLPGCIAAMFCMLLRIIMVTMEGQIPSFMYDKYPLLMGVVPLLLILCLCSVLYSVRLFCELRELHEEKNRSAILGQQLESMEEHLRETERVYAGVRAMKHDMKNQLAVVTELVGHSGEQAELQSYLTQLNRTLSKLDFPCRTGSAVVDTLVGIKFHEMRERIPGISFQADNLLVPSDLKVSPMDLSLILGNGLDNAIEACERLAEAAGASGTGEKADAGLRQGIVTGGDADVGVQQGISKGPDTAVGAELEIGSDINVDVETPPEQPWIRVETMMKASCFFLEIANSFDGRLKRSAGQEFPETLKEEGCLHGIGLQSIKATAVKYHGGADWSAVGKVFTLTVMLKNECIDKGL